jgi:hypothetical protein
MPQLPSRTMPRSAMFRAGSFSAGISEGGIVLLSNRRNPRAVSSRIGLGGYCVVFFTAMMLLLRSGAVGLAARFEAKDAGCHFKKSLMLRLF